MLLVSATGWRAAATPENYFLFFISFLLRKKKVIYFMNKNQTSDRRDDHFPLNIRFKHRGWNLFICEFEDEIISETNMLSAADSHHVISAQQRKLNLRAQSSSAARTFRTAARKKTQLSPRWLLSMFPDFRLIPRENNLAGWNICVSSSERWPRHVEETFGSRSEYLARSEQLSLLEFSWQRRTASRYSAEIIHKIHFQIPPAARRESLS